MSLYSVKLRAISEKTVDWESYVPEITFVLYICNAIKEYIDTEEIAGQAVRTYPDSFSFVGGPDTYLTIMALKEAKSTKWHYASGDVIKGWKLTQKGVQFAKEVERRKLAKYKK